MVLRRRGDLAGALELLRRQEEICRNIDDPGGLAVALGNQALVHADRHELDQALHLLEEAERISRAHSDPQGISRSLGNQANIYEQRGDLDTAMRLLAEKERICRRTNDPAGLAIVLANRALLLADRGRVDEALPLATEAHHIVTDHELEHLVGQVDPIVTALASAAAEPDRSRREARTGDEAWAMSFPGAAERIWTMTDLRAPDPARGVGMRLIWLTGKALMVVVALVLIALWWVVLVGWYAVWFLMLRPLLMLLATLSGQDPRRE